MAARKKTSSKKVTRRFSRVPPISTKPPASTEPDPPAEEDPLDLGENPHGERVVDPVKSAKAEVEAELDELLGPEPKLTREQMMNDPRYMEIRSSGSRPRYELIKPAKD